MHKYINVEKLREYDNQNIGQDSLQERKIIGVGRETQGPIVSLKGSLKKNRANVTKCYKLIRLTVKLSLFYLSLYSSYIGNISKCFYYPKQKEKKRIKKKSKWCYKEKHMLTKFKWQSFSQHR